MLDLSYERGWNEAITAVVALIEERRDDSYRTEKLTGSLPSGYRADALRDIAVDVRNLIEARADVRSNIAQPQALPPWSWG